MICESVVQEVFPARPASQVDANETYGIANWTLPKVVKDNCLEHGDLPTPKEVPCRAEHVRVGPFASGAVFEEAPRYPGHDIMALLLRT